MSSQLSRIEKTFDFEDESFRTYISAAARLDSARLEACGDQMAESDHPLVVYAAGWAAAELALYRKKGNRRRELEEFVPYETREEALDTALARWTVASKELPALREAQTEEERRTQVLGIEIRLLESIAYIPNMKIGAAMLAKEPQDDQEKRRLRDDTKSRTGLLARYVLSLPRDGSMLWVKPGLVSEVACGIAGQCDSDERYLVVPASIRQDNNPKRPLRADYVAIATDEPHRKTLVQVKSNEEGWKSNFPYICNVAANPDLKLRSRWPVSETLNVFAKSAEGESTEAEEYDLARLGRSLTAMIDEVSRDNTKGLPVKPVATAR